MTSATRLFCRINAIPGGTGAGAVVGRYAGYFLQRTPFRGTRRRTFIFYISSARGDAAATRKVLGDCSESLGRSWGRGRLEHSRAQLAQASCRRNLACSTRRRRLGAGAIRRVRVSRRQIEQEKNSAAYALARLHTRAGGTPRRRAADEPTIERGSRVAAATRLVSTEFSRQFVPLAGVSKMTERQPLVQQKSTVSRPWGRILGARRRENKDAAASPRRARPREDEPWRETERDADAPWTGRGDAAAATWIFRGGVTTWSWIIGGGGSRTLGAA